jgi:KaiC/GvpD/RAD55 family RecA-like ATPase
MMVYRCIAPDWFTNGPKVQEGQFTNEQIESLNKSGYNIYYLPNYPALYEGGTVSGFQIDKFEYVFIDCDLKDKVYLSKDEFITTLGTFPLLPTKIVDSGNGIHAYWKVNNLDAMSYLRLQKRLIRHLCTDEATSSIYQLMRVPGTLNTKVQYEPKLCELIFESENAYDCEELDKALPQITAEDEATCVRHFNITYKINTPTDIDDKIPLKFAELIKNNKEVQKIWKGGLEDRSAGDFRLGHIMFASGFTKEEAASVLVNSSKALGRSNEHKISYAYNIIDKIWTFEIAPQFSRLSSSVKDILQKAGNNIKGTRFYCWPYLDNTVTGFRLGQVIGLVAGVGVGKTAIALNAFLGFVQSNPEYTHFFVTLEQPDREIADRWKSMCGSNTNLHDKVHILSNYEEDGTYRNLGLEDIQDYLVKFIETTGKKIGCVVIDHIGVLKKSSKEGRQSIEDICHKMKAFATKTNTLLIMQSQAPREKAGIGDLELTKDSAYGTVFFEAYCDYLLTVWQPLKRCYKEGAPTVTAFKFCKIRHKKPSDVIKEDVCYKLLFDGDTERLRDLTEDEEKSFAFFLTKATNKRKEDRKTELVEYVPTTGATDGTINNHKDSGRVNPITGIYQPT